MLIPKGIVDFNLAGSVKYVPHRRDSGETNGLLDPGRSSRVSFFIDKHSLKP